MRQLFQHVPRDYTPATGYRLLRFVLPVALITSVAAACGGKSERDSKVVPYDSYPLCDDRTRTCPPGETCENNVCVPDPPERGPLEDGALTMPVYAGVDGPDPTRCADDGYCEDGTFWDLGECAEPFIHSSGQHLRGATCDAEYQPGGGKAPPGTVCSSGYLCWNSVCRSYESSDDCGQDRGCFTQPDDPTQHCRPLDGDNDGWTLVDGGPTMGAGGA